MESVTIRKIGNSLGTTFSQEFLKHMNLKEGDKVFVEKEPGGKIVLTPYDPHFDKVMDAHRKAVRKYRNAFKELANR